MTKEKPIIAVKLSGLFVKSDAWKKGHQMWFDFISQELNDESIKEWLKKEKYFEGVESCMRRLYPEKSGMERTAIARKLYFELVLDYVDFGKDGVVNKDVVDFFMKLKDNFRIALITTNTFSFTYRILDILDLRELFDIIACSELEEEDDKVLVFERFVCEHAKPVYYVGGNKKDVYEYCKKNDIPYIHANFENEEILHGAKCAKTVLELSRLIK